MYINIKLLDKDKKETGHEYTSHPLSKFVVELVYDEFIDLLFDEE